MIRVQEIIHSLEEGKWAKRIRGLVLLLLIGSLGLVYYLNLTRNFTAPEAMDAAQLARNIAEGRGYTTQFIRPLSLDILRQQGAVSDVELRSEFPDITNPPVYPMLLAGLMKVLPFEFEIDLQKPNEFQAISTGISDLAAKPSVVFCGADSSLPTGRKAVRPVGGLVRGTGVFRDGTLLEIQHIRPLRRCCCWFCFWPWQGRS